MEPYLNSQNPFESPSERKAPTGLKTLVILTVLYSGLLAIVYLFSFLFHDMYVELIDSGTMDEMFTKFPEDFQKSFEMFMGISKYAFLGYVICLTASIVGAIYMFKLKAIGFHIYILSKIAAFSVEWFVMKIPFSWMSLIVAISFIILYYSYLKFMSPVSLSRKDNNSSHDEYSNN